MHRTRKKRIGQFTHRALEARLAAARYMATGEGFASSPRAGSAEERETARRRRGSGVELLGEEERIGEDEGRGICFAGVLGF